MAVPDFQAFFLPMLEFAADGKVHSLQEAYAALADHFGLTDADRKEMSCVRQVLQIHPWHVARGLLLRLPRIGPSSVLVGGRR